MTTLTTGIVKTIFDEEFENIFIGVTIEDFHKLGFSFGDSLSFKLSTGVTVEDIPYYSGYYSGVEELMFCGYPGDPYVKIARNCGNPTWAEFQLDENSTIEVFLHEKGKYLDIQELFSLKYSDDPNDFPSIEAFANFRDLKGGNIKPHFFYRSASPCDPWHNRATYANQLIAQHHIQFVLNLSNNIQKYESFLDREDFQSQYYDNLFQTNRVLLLLLNVNYRAYDFKKKLAYGLLEMAKHEGPILVHCAEGKDRTGFVCATIMSLASAHYQDIIDDYMLTYKDYYNITEENDSKKYHAIIENIYDFLYSMCHADSSTPLEKLDLYSCAKQYLIEGGLTNEEVDTIVSYINS